MNISKPDGTPKLDLDLESAFLPAWAQKSSGDNPYAKYEGRDRDYHSGERRGRPRRDDSGRPPRRRDKSGPQGKGRQDGGGGRRDRGDRRGPKEGGGRRPGGDRGQQRNRPQGGRGDHRGFQGRGGQRRERPRRSRQEILASLPQLKTQIIPEGKGVALLAKRIRLQGRAYPLFDIAGLILQSPDRYQIRFTTQNAQKDQPQQKIWLCKVDQTVWLDEPEAIQHILQKHLDQFYTSERTEAEPPKGSFNFVAQCGISGIVLGPPNYHGYQAKLREVHGERFARMDFEHWKSKVKIVHEEEVVNKWLEEQSWTTEYTDKSNPEADKLHSLEEVEAHFRENNLSEVLECVNSAQVSGEIQKQISRPIRDLIRFHVEDQKRFPLQLATELSQQFTRQGLQFFKVNKTVTHVSVSRPHYLNLDATPVSETVKKIVQFINETPECTRTKVMDALAPAPTIEAVTSEANAESKTKETSEDVASETASADSDVKNNATAPESKPAEEAKSEPALTPEQSAVSTDLHWLIHQGHVIEFSNGKMETAKKPKEQPPKKQNKSGSEKQTAQQAPAKESTPSQDAPAESASNAQEVVNKSDAPKSEADATPASAQESGEGNTPVTSEASSTPAETSSPEAQKSEDSSNAAAETSINETATSDSANEPVQSDEGKSPESDASSSEENPVNS